MSKKEKYEKLVNHLPKEFHYTVASDGTYIYSGFMLPIHFALFIEEDKIGVKSQKVNLNKKTIKAYTTILKNLNIGKFKYRSYGGKKFKYSIWEMKIKGDAKKELPIIIKKLTKGELYIG